METGNKVAQFVHLRERNDAIIAKEVARLLQHKATCSDVASARPNKTTELAIKKEGDGIIFRKIFL